MEHTIADDVESDDALVARVRAGDHEAFEELYRRHVSGLRAYARACSRSSADAEDLVAEALTATFARLADGAGPERGFVSYVRAAIRNGAIAKGAGRQREVVTSEVELLIGEADQCIDSAQAILGLPAVERVGEAFGELRDEWKNILWRLEVEGESVAQIADDLGVSRNALAASAHRAREALRDGFLSRSASSQPCSAYSSRELASYLRKSCPPGRARKIADHLPTCASCQLAMLDMSAVGVPTRRLLGAVLLGGFGWAGDATSQSGPDAAWLGRSSPWHSRWTWMVTGVVVVLVAAWFFWPEGSEDASGDAAGASDAQVALAAPGDESDGSPDRDVAGAADPDPSLPVSDSPSAPVRPSPADTNPGVPDDESVPGGAVNPSPAPEPTVPQPPIPGLRGAAWADPGPGYAPGAQGVPLELTVSYSNQVSGQGYDLEMTVPTGVAVRSSSGGCTVAGATVSCASDSTIATAEQIKWLLIVDVAPGGGPTPLPTYRITAASPA